MPKRVSSPTHFLIAASLVFATHGAAAAPDGFPAWMAGSWCSRDDHATSEEHWLAPAGGIMLGMSRTVRQGRKAEFEFLRVETVDAVPAYIAQPEGAPPTTFRRTGSGSDWIRFENKAHDFPQRVEYRRKDEVLRAEIAGPGKDGKEAVIPFELVRCKVGPPLAVDGVDHGHER